MRNPCIWCCLVLLTLVVCDSCFHEERRHLMDICDAFLWPAGNPPDWSSRDCCRWERVTCSSITGRVTALDLDAAYPSWYGLLNCSMFLPFRELQNLSLRNAGIMGCMPGAGFEVWSNLRQLEILDLSENELNDSSIMPLVGLASLHSLFLGGNVIKNDFIVQRLSKMKLDILDLSWNGIFGNISRAVCNMTSLRELHLNGNFFFGVLPSCIRNLTFLRVLDLSNNLLMARFPTISFANMTSLEQLSLSHNQLEGLLLLNSFSNHLQLKYLRLSSNSASFQVQTENPEANISSQLQVLELSNCNLNANSGVVPSFLSHQHGLYLIDVSNNNLSGHFPTWLLENNIYLSYLSVKHNSFVGPLILPSKVNKNLSWLDASYSRLSGDLPVDINITFPNLSYLNLSKNFFQGIFPSAISHLENLATLDLSYNNISGDITASFPTTMSMNHLVLNDNNISGEIPTSICTNVNLGVVDFSNNKFTGSIPNCIASNYLLFILNLRGNHLTGSIPTSLSSFLSLQFLDLSKNHLSGPVPSLPNLTYLHLSENELNGTFPLVWSFGANLKTMDLRYNQFSGAIPRCIDETFPKLRILLLKGNMFEGMVPNQVCHLRYLRLLDLSNNMLSGLIPSCLSNMGLYGEFFSFQYGDIVVNVTAHLSNTLHEIFQIGFYREFNSTMLELDREEFTTKGRQDYYKGNLLSYMSGLDFSSNQLEGPIPESIGDMAWLRALNFSNNSFSGPVPISLSNLSNLESLDLSHNRLSGQLSPQLAGLKSLEVFSVAYNNLSGPTLGTKGQFITFGQSSYEGNPYLCGPPLLKSCSTVPTPSIPQHEQDEDDDDKVGDVVLFCGTALFYVVGFWTSLAVLFFKRSWRCSLFLAVDRFSDPLMFQLAMLSRRIHSTN
uniref:non-specific serine/threonine protein kinase n=1 Tax=Oryza barthii TaxID=65489 RepID=A0A0D3GDG5_9ORYZ